MEKLLDEIESYWSTRTEGYSEVNHKELAGTQKNAWLKVLTSQFPDKPKEEIRILDIGTGPGFFPVILAEAGYHVDAVDYTEGMLEKAKENAGELCRNIRFQRMDAQKLEFADNTFDVVISRNLTWNLEYPEQALEEWERVLAPGGRMIYFDANWYLYLYDEELRARKKAAEAAFRAKYPVHNYAGNMSKARVLELEQTAYALPLSKEKRPEWDKKVLEKLGMRMVEVIEDIGPGVQDPLDWERDSLNHTFMICAEKPVTADQG